MADDKNYIRWFEDLNKDDVKIVGGKNASLGEMISSLKPEGIKVPNGFATTAEAYSEFLKQNKIEEEIKAILKKLKGDNSNLEETGRRIRKLFYKNDFPGEIKDAITKAYRELSDLYETKNVDVAVRSSATAEDLPGASFAGQQESFLNVSGEEELTDACKKCYASLFTDRAISYRQEKGFDHMKIALSVGNQKMIRSDKAGSGVMFTLDTETGFRDVVVINAAWGLGENVVQGSVNPDEYQVYKKLLDDKNVIPIIEKKPGEKEKKMIYAGANSGRTKNVETSKKEQRSFVLNDDEIIKLARWAAIIEKHYKTPMDIEWAKDSKQKELFIVQARPETVQSQDTAKLMKSYKLKEKKEPIITGRSIGGAIAAGKVLVLQSADEIDRFEDDAILVTGMTDPDWVPVMKRASGIITDYGGRTSHAAIVSRELGIPAIVGSGEATKTLKDRQEVTMSCAEGENGFVYEGILEYEVEDLKPGEIPETNIRIQINMASPAASFRWWKLPNEGIGLARMEFIINNIIKIHPMALVRYDVVKDKEAKKQIRELTKGFENKEDYFVENLSRGIAKIAAPQYPNPVVVRMSDFKTNEYAQLIGGKEFEPDEENPMLGFRGASRYYSENYREGFALECRAIKKAREEIGLKNIIIMIPFCRTLSEADKVLQELADNGLVRGQDGLKVFVMAEVPSNIILADKFAKRFDGFSIGSNDLTQLTLGVDRDSSILSGLFDEREEAVKVMIEMLIKKAHDNNIKVGICGQAPSDYPEVVDFLVKAGIDSISLNPDSVLDIKKRVAELEAKLVMREEEVVH